MDLHWFSKQRNQLLVGSSLMLVVAAVLLNQFTGSTPTNTANTDVVRQEYAGLYQAAWRQDEGDQPTLVTATLLLPPTQAALGRDTGRSSTEDQLWDVLKNLDSKHVPVILTFDSVSGFVPDSVVTAGTSLVLDGGPNVTLSDWKPMTSPTRVVNTDGTIRSQIGVAIFSAGESVDWTTIKSAKLVVHGIPGERDRIFSWTEPRLLLEV